MSMFALMLAAATPAAQDFTPVQQDARCTVALQQMAENMTGDERGAVAGVMLFYMGRLSVQLKPTQIEGTIDAAGTTLDAAEYQPVALECVERMRTLSGIG